ncbi:Glycine Receptor Subunit Alpha-2 [Manis pentadactyla]|nr:Glycine Receptor Subunit Alpha-2 [Manis pentadactyla]
MRTPAGPPPRPQVDGLLRRRICLQTRKRVTRSGGPLVQLESRASPRLLHPPRGPSRFPKRSAGRTAP